MKSITKLLNLLTVFLSAIGICAASLVGFIVVYTQINGGFSPKLIANQNAVVNQASNNTVNSSFNTELNDNSVFESLPEDDILSNYNVTNSIPLVVESTLTETYDQPTYDSYSIEAETDYITDFEISNVPDFAIDTTPIEQEFTAAIPASQNVSNDTYLYDEAPIESFDQIVNEPVTDENYFNAYVTSVLPASTPATDTVWLAKTGTKYHRIAKCRHMNPNNARQVPLEEAILEGYEPCKNCF